MDIIHPRSTYFDHLEATSSLSSYSRGDVIYLEVGSASFEVITTARDHISSLAFVVSTRGN
jgi:hypothetical protein